MSRLNPFYNISIWVVGFFILVISVLLFYGFLNKKKKESPPVKNISDTITKDETDTKYQNIVLPRDSIKAIENQNNHDKTKQIIKPSSGNDNNSNITTKKTKAFINCNSQEECIEKIANASISANDKNLLIEKVIQSYPINTKVRINRRPPITIIFFLQNLSMGDYKNYIVEKYEVDENNPILYIKVP